VKPPSPEAVATLSAEIAAFHRPVRARQVGIDEAGRPGTASDVVRPPAPRPMVPQRRLPLGAAPADGWIAVNLPRDSDPRPDPPRGWESRLDAETLAHGWLRAGEDPGRWRRADRRRRPCWACPVAGRRRG